MDVTLEVVAMMSLWSGPPGTGRGGCRRRPFPRWFPALVLAASVPGCQALVPSAGGLEAEPVLVFFSHEQTSDVCVADHPVVRMVAGRTPRAAMQALLRGPTGEETGRGYSSWFSPATADALVALDVQDGVARVDFAGLDRLIPNASSSCGSSALLSSLDNTLRQFADVRQTRYSLNGDESAFYLWLQMAPPEP